MKALFTGMGMAAVAGLLMGAAMKPDLRGDDRPEGPQIFAGWSAERSTGPFDPGMTYADYNGQVPDYVVGTDWTKSAYDWQDDEAYEPVAYEAAEAQPAPAPTYPVVRYEEPARAEALYPSISGGVAHDASDRVPEALPAKPAVEKPALAPANIDAEAPPEATGDTSRVM